MDYKWKSGVRQFVRKKFVCNAIPAQQIMGNYLASRVTPAQPFIDCDAVYGRPIHIKSKRGREQETLVKYHKLCSDFSFSEIFISYAVSYFFYIRTKIRSTNNKFKKKQLTKILRQRTFVIQFFTCEVN